MSSILKSILFIAIGLIVTSCQTVCKIPIQLMEDSKGMIPIEDNVILVINRGNNYLSRDLDSLALQGFFIQNHLETDTVINCPMLTDIATQSMADQLYKQNKDVLLDLNSFRYDTLTNDPSKIIKPELSKTDMLFLQAKYHASKALVLEGIITQLKGDIYNDQYQGGYRNYEVQGKYVAVWKYYDLEKKEMLISVNKESSLYWESQGSGLSKVLEKVPPYYEMVKNIAYVSSEDVVKKFIPQWNNSTRNLFAINKIYEESHIFPKAKKFQWEEVKEYYLKCLDNPKFIKKKAVILYNLAVCNEMLGEVKEAMKQINKALAIKYSYPADQYRKMLEKIITQKEGLKN
ncbi:hypothetical protein K4L44_09665 [Halosquirtibacter laminarini]|uniref:Uncharacterized protein n=1 Tax=Halosquirtibacter laminarini TaxID=3374600 RepID=A0AC61NBP5_9BACT|nr:hypothetical protein K4L44_09665 [Prolixibacteraceae bacterium]